jgi:hypothetical protein
MRKRELCTFYICWGWNFLLVILSWEDFTRLKICFMFYLWWWGGVCKVSLKWFFLMVIDYFWEVLSSFKYDNRKNLYAGRGDIVSESLEKFFSIRQPSFHFSLCKSTGIFLCNFPVHKMLCLIESTIIRNSWLDSFQ